MVNRHIDLDRGFAVRQIKIPLKHRSVFGAARASLHFPGSSRDTGADACEVVDQLLRGSNLIVESGQGTAKLRFFSRKIGVHCQERIRHASVDENRISITHDPHQAFDRSHFVRDFTAAHMKDKLPAVRAILHFIQKTAKRRKFFSQKISRDTGNAAPVFKDDKFRRSVGRVIAMCRRGSIVDDEIRGSLRII